MSERNGTVVCPGSYDPVTNHALFHIHFKRKGEKILIEAALKGLKQRVESL